MEQERAAEKGRAEAAHSSRKGRAGALQPGGSRAGSRWLVVDFEQQQHPGALATEMPITGAADAEADASVVRAWSTDSTARASANRRRSAFRGNCGKWRQVSSQS
jgi:hypothetical protein